MGSLKEKKITKIQSTFVEQREKKQLQKSKKRRGLYRRLVLFGVIVFILSGLTISTLLSQASAIDKKTGEKEKVEQKLASLERNQLLLEEEIVKLNDDEYIAKIARRDYFLSNKGEVIFNLPKKKEASD
jgi:cell division protein DivIC